MPNNKTLQFLCSKCNLEVFRLGAKVNKDHKLCGKCNKQSTTNDIDILPQLTLEQDLIATDTKTPVTHLGSVPVSDVVAKVKYYRNRLDKVLELAPNNPQESFYSLWKLTE